MDSRSATEGEVYVPPLQRTQGQSPPIAANGGLSYAAFERNGDAGTSAATEAAIAAIADGEGHALVDMLDNAPAGPIETKWGLGFQRFSECLEYIRTTGIEAPKGGLAVPLRYSINERPSYSIVSSNACPVNVASMSSVLTNFRGSRFEAEVLQRHFEVA